MYMLILLSQSYISECCIFLYDFYKNRSMTIWQCSVLKNVLHILRFFKSFICHYSFNSFRHIIPRNRIESRAFFSEIRFKCHRPFYCATTQDMKVYSGAIICIFFQFKQIQEPTNNGRIIHTGKTGY